MADKFKDLTGKLPFLEFSKATFFESQSRFYATSSAKSLIFLPSCTSSFLSLVHNSLCTTHPRLLPIDVAFINP